MHEVLVNRLGGLNLPGKSMVRLTDSPDMTTAVYCGCKTTAQQQQHILELLHTFEKTVLIIFPKVLDVCFQ